MTLDMSEKAQELACKVMGLAHIRDLVFVYLDDLIRDPDIKLRMFPRDYLAQYLTLSKGYASSIIKILWARADDRRFSEMTMVCDPQRINLYRSSVLRLKISRNLVDLLDAFELQVTFPRLRYVQAWFEGCGITIDLVQANDKPRLDIQLARGHPLPLDHPGLWLWPAETARFRLLSLKDGSTRPIHEDFRSRGLHSSQTGEEEEERRAVEDEEKKQYGSSCSIILEDEAIDEREFLAAVFRDIKQLDLCDRSMPLEQLQRIAEVALTLESLDVVVARRDISTAVQTRVQEYDALFRSLAGCRRLKRLAIFAKDYDILSMPPLHYLTSLEVFEWHLDVHQIYSRHREEISLIGKLPQPPSGSLKRVKFWIPGQYGMETMWFTRFVLKNLPIDADIEFQVANASINLDGNGYNCGQQDHQGGCEAIAFAQWVSSDYSEIVDELRQLRS